MADANLLLDIDVTDPTYRILAAFGSRLDALLKKPKVPADDNLAGTLDEFLGALYALILANLIYWTVLILIALAKALSLAVIAFGLIASAVCGLLGPIFVPFFIVPKLDWLFWGWLKSFIQYSFIPVVAIAFLMIFERFVFRYVTTLPPTVTSAEYGVYGLQAVAVIVTFCIGIVLVPSLTSSIFSGQGGQAIVPGIPRAIRTRF